MHQRSNLFEGDTNARASRVTGIGLLMLAKVFGWFRALQERRGEKTLTCPKDAASRRDRLMNTSSSLCWMSSKAAVNMKFVRPSDDAKNGFRGERVLLFGGNLGRTQENNPL